VLAVENDMGMKGTLNIGHFSWKQVVSKIGVIVCLASSMNACSFHQQYPSEWAPIVAPSKGCLDIAGNYLDTVNPHKVPSLSNILIKKWVGAGKLDKASHLQITRDSDNTITVTAWNERIPIASRTYKKDEYACTDKGIEISMGMDATAQNVVGLMWGKVTLAKAGDNSLVVISESGGAGLGFLIVPLAGTDLQYFRYPAKEDERQGKTEGSAINKGQVKHSN
jgi:hypothetical protein